MDVYRSHFIESQRSLGAFRDYCVLVLGMAFICLLQSNSNPATNIIPFYG